MLHQYVCEPQKVITDDFKNNGLLPGIPEASTAFSGIVFPLLFGAGNRAGFV